MNVNQRLKEMFEHRNPDNHLYKTNPGLNEEIIRKISQSKNEPEWMLNLRLKSFEVFKQKEVPQWGPSLNDLDTEKIIYYAVPNAKQNSKSWDDVPQDIKDTFTKLGIPEAEQKYLSGVGAQYDCLTEDTLIPTNPKGMTKIKDIKKGDEVFVWDGKKNIIVKSKVKEILYKGFLPVFEIKVRGKSIKATYNHPFLTLVDERKSGRKRSRYSKKWIYLNELKKGSIIAVATDLPNFGKSFKFLDIEFKKNVVGRNQFGAVYNLNIENRYTKIKFPNESNEDLMWFFGFYLGDGYISRAKDKMRLNFAVPEDQIELKNKIKKIAKEYFDYQITTEDKFRVSINSTKICLFFKENGFFGNARTKKIPGWVNTIPKEQKLALIAGYIDSDGTVRKKEKDAIITSINYELLKQIKEICVYCGLDTSKITDFKYKLVNKDIVKIGHRIQISGRTKSIPCEHPIKKLRLEAKKRNFGYHNSLDGTTIRKYCSENVGFSRIEDIKYIGEEKTYDIEVEDHHNFVANGIIAHNSTNIYHKLKKELEEKGVIFEDMDSALQKYPDLVKEYFMTKCIPITLHKYSALHGAVWSSGTFIYVPENVKLEKPLQAYFRMNTSSFGQFEHTLIIVEKNAEAHYIEGCSSPKYDSVSLHAGCVELFVKEGARLRYSSVENWSKDTYNLNTKRAIVEKNGLIEWVTGNTGSRVSMVYPCSILKGEDSRADHLSMGYAGKNQIQDIGAKIYHLAPNTTSVIKSKSISKNGGIARYRGLLIVSRNAKNAKSKVQCDALMLDNISKSDTIPVIEIKQDKASIAHEATVGKISQEQIFYLMSRGLTEEQANQIIVNGFIEPIIKELPIEYALELNKLIELEMEGSLG